MGDIFTPYVEDDCLTLLNSIIWNTEEKKVAILGIGAEIAQNGPHPIMMYDTQSQLQVSCVMSVKPNNVTEIVVSNTTWLFFRP